MSSEIHGVIPEQSRVPWGVAFSVNGSESAAALPAFADYDAGGSAGYCIFNLYAGK